MYHTYQTKSNICAEKLFNQHVSFLQSFLQILNSILIINTSKIHQKSVFLQVSEKTLKSGKNRPCEVYVTALIYKNDERTPRLFNFSFFQKSIHTMTRAIVTSRSRWPNPKNSTPCLSAGGSLNRIRWRGRYIKIEMTKSQSFDTLFKRWLIAQYTYEMI